MAEPTADVANDSIDKRKDVDDKPLSSRFWLGEITAAIKRDKEWITRADKVVARYRDERNLDRTSASERRANILWSNTETLKATLFTGLGNPDVRRRFPKKGQDDKAARQAALVLERGLSFCADAYDAESQIEASVEDELLPGRGTAWIVYDAEINEYAGSEGGEGGSDNPQEPVPEIAAQTVKIEHVFFKDFLTSAGRKWSDVWWCSRGHDYSRDELTKYFPKHAKDIPLDVEVAGYQENRRKSKAKDEEDTFKRARVWEIWDKSKRERVYVAEGYKLVLKKDADPYKLKDFFPTVEPLYGVKTTSTLVPIPEYTLYQDQAEELDTITTRLARLTDALKRRGVYDAGSEGSEGTLSSLAMAGDNEFIPIRNFAAMMEKGGLERVFMTEDLAPLIAVIDKLSVRGQTLVQTIYEITGISDIIRGASDPNETATAQKIKGQFGSMRLKKRQKRIQVFVRDLFRLKAEIMAEHFTREQLAEMTGIDMPLQAEQQAARQKLASIEKQQQMAQQAAKQGAGAVAVPQIDPKVMQQLLATVKAVSWEEIAAILRSDQRRGYKVDIETDATNAMDSETEKQQRMEFLGAMQGMLEKVMPALQTLPPPIAQAVVPLLKENSMFAVGAFKAGRTMEETYEDTFEKIEQAMKAMASRPPKPDPEEQKLQLEAKSKQMEFEFKTKEAQQDRQLKEQEFQHTSRLQEQEMMHTQKLEEFKAQNEAALQQRKMEQEQQFRAMEFDNQQRMAEQQSQFEFQNQSRQSALKEQEADRSFALEDRKMAQGAHNDERKQAFEREKFERQAVAEGQTPQGGTDGTSQLVQALAAEVAQLKEMVAMMMGGQGGPQMQPA